MNLMAYSPLPTGRQAWGVGFVREEGVQGDVYLTILIAVYYDLPKRPASERNKRPFPPGTRELPALYFLLTTFD